MSDVDYSDMTLGSVDEIELTLSRKLILGVFLLTIIGLLLWDYL